MLGGECDVAVDIQINADGFLSQKKLDFLTFLMNTKLEFGTYNPYFVLEEDNTSLVGLLYNPNRMGRGIYFDGSKMEEGQVMMSINLPTTAQEVDDFMSAVGEIRRQYRDVSLVCEKKTVTYGDFLQSREQYLEYSINTLKNLCATKEYEAAILTLAAFPYTLTPDEMDFFALEGDLQDFEELIHQKQVIEANYACPKIMRNESTDQVVAFYTFTEDCATILPLECNGFMSLEKVDIHCGLVRFYIDSIKKVLPGYYDYSNYIDLLHKRDVAYFDGDHLLTPAYSLRELVEIAKELEKMPTPDYDNKA